MADLYEAKVFIKVGGRVIDSVYLDDEDYGWLMKRLGMWANDSEATKDL
jgi:hypothetical protein